MPAHKCTKHPLAPRTNTRCRECQKLARRRYEERMRIAYRQMKAIEQALASA